MRKMDIAAYAAMLGLTAEMVLDEAVKRYKQNKLYDDIDRALACGDETAFLSLTEQLKQMEDL